MLPSKHSSGRVLTVLNLKGGVGKTHTTWLLASVCQERGHRVLLVDTDTQGNLTSSFLDESNAGEGTAKLLHPGSDHDPLPLIRRTTFSHIDILPSGPSVARFDVSNQAEWEKSDLQRCFVEPVRTLGEQYDYILFDCPPRLSLVSFAALTASDGIVIPMETADWGAQGIVQVTEAVEYVQRRYNPRLKLLGYLPSRYKQARLYHKTYLANLRKHFGSLAFDTVLPDLAAFERAVTDRVPITLHSPASRAAAIARRLFDEVEYRLAGSGGSGEPGSGQGVFKTSVVGTAS
jgi:chromosome partitioning protein